MNHIFINEQNIRQLIHQLAASEPFQSGRFQLYQDVPLKALDYAAPSFCRRRNLATMDAHTAMQSMDFLICRQSEAVLAVTFDLDPRESKALFDSTLFGLPIFSVNLCAFLSPDIPDTLWQILQLLSDMEEEGQQISPYRLRVGPLDPVLSEDDLLAGKFICQDGFATHYGRDCGLIFQITAAGKVPHASCKLQSCFQQAANWNRDCVDNRKISVLRALLRAPVGEFLPSSAPDIPLKTYLAAHGAAEDGQSLRDIAQALCQPDCLRSYEILRMPLQDYFEATAYLTNSYFHLWKFQMDVRPFLNPEIPEDSITLSLALQNALTEHMRPTLAELLLPLAPFPGAG